MKQRSFCFELPRQQAMQLTKQTAAQTFSLAKLERSLDALRPLHRSHIQKQLLQPRSDEHRENKVSKIEEKKSFFLLRKS
jgi:hypothetical protein